MLLTIFVAATLPSSLGSSPFPGGHPGGSEAAEWQMREEGTAATGNGFPYGMTHFFMPHLSVGSSPQILGFLLTSPRAASCTSQKLVC